MSLKNRELSLVVSNFDIGAGKKGAAKGALALMEKLSQSGVVFQETIVLNNNGEEPEDNAHPYCKHIEPLSKAAELLNNTVLRVIKDKRLPIVFSGDHSNAIGALSGLRNAHPDKRIGVIWVDAHADLHSPFTTPSGNMHGMPLAVLAGIDNTENQKNPVSEAESKAWHALKHLGQSEPEAKISLQDLVFIGLRDAEPQEWAVIDKYGVLYFDPESIRTHGIYHVINHSKNHLAACDLIYVSFDVDSMDPSVATGTGTPVENGLSLHEAEAVFKSFMQLPNLGAFEITEINPLLDKGRTAMADVVCGLFEAAIRA